VRERLLAVVLVAVASAPACGDDPAASDEPCGASIDGEAVPITLRIGDDRWFVEAFEDLIDGFNDSQDDVVASLDVVGGHPARFGLDLLRSDAAVPALVVAHPGTVDALIEAEAIIPLDGCAGTTDDDLGRFFPPSLAAYTRDGAHWALPRNLFTTVLAYDRTAFADAGLDPDSPPRTLAELHAASTALAELGRFEAPMAIADPISFLVASGVPLTSQGAAAFDMPDAVAVASELAAMTQEGLILGGDPAPSPLPPIGAGRVAVEQVDLGGIWGYASALAEGQAPAADIGVMAIPGLHGPSTPVGGAVFVLPSATTPREQAAAWRLLRWLEQPAQQAQLHVLTDTLPSDPAAGDEPVATGYWDELPLFEAAWSLVAEHARGPQSEADPLVMGVPELLVGALWDIVDGADPAATLDAAAGDVDALLATYRGDRAGWIECVIDSPPAACLATRR
jgi:sn-glycerol 3-phosphate transport system substrate-binding protein